MASHKKEAGIVVIKCEFCMVTVPSEEAMEMHVKGKRHQRIVEITEKREKQASFTVFTRGFKDDTSEEELQEYFSKFGTIASIFMEYKRTHVFALVEFEEEASAAAAIAEKNHELKGEKITVRPRKVKKIPRRALRAKHMKNKYRASMKNAREIKKAMAVDRDMLIQKITTASSIEEQMRVLADYVRMTDDEIKSKKEICENLQTALSKFFPSCSIHQFGSSVNGFGTKGCDADIYLDFHDDEEEEAMETQTDLPPIKLPYHRDIQSLPKNEGPLSTADLRQMTPYDKVKLVSRILVDHALGCNNIIAIPSARIPLVKFIHEPTGIKCDLSINNKLALRNTRLLQMCSRIDERVGLMVSTVRSWAKIKEIAGSLSAGHRVTNYALTFLVIQYLQNLDIPILPTISKLAEMAGKQKVIIDGWDCSYPEEAITFGQTANKKSLEDLLKGFFRYYSNIDFSTVVFQTRTGNVMPIREMVEKNKEINKAPGDARPFKIAPICIQDPFVLDHNIAGNVSEKMKQKIAEEFQVAAEKCKNWTNIEEAVEKGEVFGLTDLFAKMMPQELFERICKVRKMDEDNEEGNTFSMVLKVAQLPLEAFKTSQTPDFRLNWCFKVCLFMQHVLETILMFETDILAQTISEEIPKEEPKEVEKEMEVDEPKKLEESPRKRRSTRQSAKPGAKKSREEPFVTPKSAGRGVGPISQQHYTQKVGIAPPGTSRSPSLHMELICSSCCRTWNGRKTLRKEVMADGELDGLELEREISEQIIENVGFSPKYLVQFRMDIDTVVETSKTAVSIKMEPIGGAKEFACFFPFFKTFIRKLVEKNLYEKW